MKQTVMLALVFVALNPRGVSAQCVAAHSSPKEIIEQLAEHGNKGGSPDRCRMGQGFAELFTDQPRSLATKL